MAFTLSLVAFPSSLAAFSLPLVPLLADFFFLYLQVLKIAVFRKSLLFVCTPPTRFVCEFHLSSPSDPHPSRELEFALHETLALNILFLLQYRKLIISFNPCLHLEYRRGHLEPLHFLLLNYCLACSQGDNNCFVNNITFQTSRLPIGRPSSMRFYNVMLSSVDPGQG